MSRDLSKYRHPEPPPGYVSPDLTWIVPEHVIDGVSCPHIYFLFKTGIFEEDADGLSDLNISSDEEDVAELHCEVTADEETPVNNILTTSENIEEKIENIADLTISDKQLQKRKIVDDDYGSDSSSSSKTSGQHRSKKLCQTAPGDERKTSEYLFGCYPCEVCNITLNSHTTFKTHMSGKKHQKAIKAKDVAVIEIKAPNPDEVNIARYPQPSPGIIRKRENKVSYMQDEILKSVTTPCPGLGNVVEIRGLKETSYYCKLCDAPCSVNCIIPHLKGFKHTLQCLRLFKPTMYMKVVDEPKYKIIKDIYSVLRAVQLREGVGHILVEQDYLDENFCEHEREMNESSIASMPSTSRQGNYQTPNRFELPFSEYYAATAVPDTSKSDFYCQICESHMNSTDMWESHIRGKRHLANIKKNPGARPSKLKLIPMAHGRPLLLDKFHGIDKPIVGLSHIREVQNVETRKEMYQCFLCGGCLTSVNIIDHLLTQKHRTKYLEQIKHPGMELLRSMNFKENNSCHLVEELCYEAEKQYGRGVPELYLTKGAVGY